MKSNIGFYLKLILKRWRDLKIITKVRLSLFGISLCVIFSTSIYSYYIGKQSLIENSLDSMVIFEKQAGNSLDDKINVFRDVSYQILQLERIQQILRGSDVITQQIGDNRVADVICRQSTMFDYTKAAFLMTNEKKVYRYYKYGEKKLSADAEDELLQEVCRKVTETEPVCWTVYEGQICFVRKIINEDFQEQGFFCSIVTDSFLHYMDKNLTYLNDENMLVFNKNEELMKAGVKDIPLERIRELINYREKDFYTYYTSLRNGDRIYLTVVLNTPQNDWTIVGLCDERELLKGVDKIWTAMLRNLAIITAVIMVITSLMSRNITENVRILETGMKQYEKGQFQYRIRPRSYDEVGVLGLQLNYMAVKISNLIELLQKEQEKKQRLEFETLQAQINPHFLYNTLGSLKWAAFRQGNKELSASIDSLINLLRFTIKRAGDMVTVKEEIEYIRNFIEIERMHYGTGFEVVYNLKLDDSLMMPGFVLQPIVENCFVHGLDMAEAGGCITILGRQEEQAFYLEVSDNGVGMTKEETEALLKEKKKSKTGFSSIGVRIVDERLRTIYGADYEMQIKSKVGQGTVVSLRIPIREGEYEISSVDR